MRETTVEVYGADRRQGSTLAVCVESYSQNNEPAQ
jgi:hypothetical protein